MVHPVATSHHPQAEGNVDDTATPVLNPVCRSGYDDAHVMRTVDVRVAETLRFALLITSHSAAQPTPDLRSRFASRKQGSCAPPFASTKSLQNAVHCNGDL
jgi:hypothetical protein